MSHVFLEIAKVWNEIEKKVEEMQAEFPADDLNIYQLHILNSLFEKDCQHASELAKSVGKAATSFTPVLDKLQMAGLVERVADKADRRAIFVYLTPKALKRKEEVQHIVGEIDALFAKRIRA